MDQFPYKSCRRGESSLDRSSKKTIPERARVKKKLDEWEKKEVEAKEKRRRASSMGNFRES